MRRYGPGSLSAGVIVRVTTVDLVWCKACMAEVSPRHECAADVVVEASVAEEEVVAIA